VAIAGKNGQEASIVVPSDAEKDKTIHLILEVSDNGTPEGIAPEINRLATSNPDLIFNY
jgi:hypothetical protein